MWSGAPASCGRELVMTNEKNAPEEPEGGKLYHDLSKLFGALLRRHSFECISYKYEKAFGNEIIEFTSARIGMRLLNDRGRFYADVAPNTGDAAWFAANDLFELLDVSEQDIARGIDDIAAFAKLVTKNFDGILTLLSTDTIAATRDKLAALHETRRLNSAGGDSSYGKTIH
jgi:hypothetical protein